MEQIDGALECLHCCLPSELLGPIRSLRVGGAIFVCITVPYYWLWGGPSRWRGSYDLKPNAVLLSLAMNN